MSVERNRIKHRDIVARLTPAQYHALSSAVALQSAEYEAGDSGTKTDLAVLNRAWDSIKTAWHRAGEGF